MKIPSESGWQVVVEELLSKYPQGAVIGLSGPLGAGKSTLVRTFIHEVARLNGAKSPRVVSPTFVFRQTYGELSPPVEHFDLYRLENIGESTLQELGVIEAVEFAKGQKGFVFIEWPEKISAGHFTFDLTLSIAFAAAGRLVTLS